MRFPSEVLDICRTPQGRASILTALANEESYCADLVMAMWPTDALELPKLMLKQYGDEQRHVAIFRERAAAQGAVSVSRILPEKLTIDKMVSLTTPKSPIELAMITRVLEETTIDEYPQLSEAMRSSDDETANLLMSVVEDEKKHVKYCMRVALVYGQRSEVEAVYRRMIAARDEVRA